MCSVYRSNWKRKDWHRMDFKRCFISTAKHNWQKQSNAKSCNVLCKRCQMVADFGQNGRFSCQINMTHPIQVMKLLFLIWRVESVWEVPPEAGYEPHCGREKTNPVHIKLDSHCFHFFLVGTCIWVRYCDTKGKFMQN